MSRVFQTPQDLARARAQADAAQDLLDAGVISAQEQQALLDAMWQMHRQDHASHGERAARAATRLNEFQTRLAMPADLPGEQ